MREIENLLERLPPGLADVALIIALLAVAVVADLIAKRILLRSLRAVTRRTQVTWDDALVERNVFGRLAQLVPALIIFSGLRFIPGLPDQLAVLVANVTVAYMVLMLTLTLTAALGAANDIYEGHPVARERPLKGVVQLLQIGIYLIGGVLIVAVLLDRSPLLLLSGLRGHDRDPAAGLQGHDPGAGGQRAADRQRHGASRRLDRDAAVRRRRRRRSTSRCTR